MEKWNTGQLVWQCAKQQRSNANANHKNLIKHLARVRKDEWEPVSRYSIGCPYCQKHYSSATHLVVQLGIRPIEYTWPTCTFPLKHGNIVLTALRGYIHGKLIHGRQILITHAKEKARKQMQGKRAMQLAHALLPGGYIGKRG